MYDSGRGVPQDYTEAAKWYRLAATQGDANAQVMVGLRYDRGKGVPQDYVQAAKWFRLAAEQGEADAQSQLGSMYQSGRGVAQDYVRAYMWFSLLGASGEPVDGKLDNKLRDIDRNLGRTLRDIVAKMMTPQQVVEAQKLARECQQRDFKGCD
jgi:hypothetical protein